MEAFLFVLMVTITGWVIPIPEETNPLPRLLNSPPYNYLS
jgi:hypothetical protein